MTLRRERLASEQDLLDGLNEAELDARTRLRLTNALRKVATDSAVPTLRLSMAIGFSPSAAIFSPHWWPCFLPAGGHESPHPQRCCFEGQVSALTPFPAVA